VQLRYAAYADIHNSLEHTRPMRSIHAILTCRVVLHTREQAKVDTIVLGQGNAGETSTLGRPTETLRFVGPAGEEVEEEVV
jgi:hypothetical protein